MKIIHNHSELLSRIPISKDLFSHKSINFRLQSCTT